ncbi:hypothetical protein NMG60_11028528 [Bertholletia excelsa]
MDLRKLSSRRMGSLRMSSFLAIFLLSVEFSSLSEASHLKKLPSAVVVGSVYCNTCSPDDFSRTSHFISGALVAVECGGSNSEPAFREEVKTNDNGEFRVHLPFSVHKQIKEIKSCSVKLISSGENYCAVASTSTSSSTLYLKSKHGNEHIFSAGFFSFKPLKQPASCNKLSDGEVAKRQLQLVPILPSPPSIFPPNPFLPPPSIFPPNPFQPPPSILPPNPFQPSPPSIFPPNPFQPSPPSIFPPNPFQRPPSPPSIFPPNPFQPPPSPPSIFPPNPFRPPPSPPSLFPPIVIPPIPGFTPPSPPPPPPSIFPPIPGIPIPPFPKIPPASPSKETSP